MIIKILQLANLMLRKEKPWLKKLAKSAVTLPNTTDMITATTTTPVGTLSKTIMMDIITPAMITLNTTDVMITTVMTTITSPTAAAILGSVHSGEISQPKDVFPNMKVRQYRSIQFCLT
ncbi:hypothetical protein FRB95_002753 [Tulasnella sp. JGI-2019a]|nr:hypothetical protein FRB95_002753 [Tulasnella sp. JGI-2019a]